ncbi:hypothetical protein [Actinoplanes sp. CA-252034]
MQSGQVVGIDAGHPDVEFLSAAAGEQAGEVLDALGEDGQVRAGGEEIV